jgi:hypothetical protein
MVTYSAASSLAFAWGAEVLKNPVGLQGAVPYFLATSVTQLVQRWFVNVTGGKLSDGIQTIVRLALTIFSHAVVWKTLAMAGFAFSLPHMVLLSGFSMGAGGVISSAIGGIEMLGADLMRALGCC